MKYNIITTSDKSYFKFLRILINSIYKSCDMSNINNIFIVDTGLEKEQIDWLNNKSDIIQIIDTNYNTSFQGGTWGVDWQLNVKSKTVTLHQTLEALQQPLLMLDADMLVIKDLDNLTKKGGDIQVCYRNDQPTEGSQSEYAVPYIGSYFFSIDYKKSSKFIGEWKDLTNNSSEEGPVESRSLVKTIKKYKNLDLDIVEIDESIVNVTRPENITNDTCIIHFKGATIDWDIENSISNRTEGRGFSKIIEEYS